ncbi:Aspartyl-tRNA(Asn) amidotransferase subunit B @ Glutamyl-tRNA(Gln) amidotransferase subunit B [hydrothermal vent metagenome]|uniref:Aspartyl-tRNA(Asn) amidotransferase subunit B @ Glutamyl-tRNA(Gln) amidotransferase subunit B n=1 Tax=hydrothermal vent metagenome TaxID=652676 RepID=A0A3B1D9K0_9ZZZZ
MTTETKQKYETVIGLEVHLQLSTNTKIFCGCANSFGKEPNTLTCPVCLGFPGALPVVNKKTLEYAIRIGLALNCKINPFVKFDRKNYFYPDCPKAYQISQFDFPICHTGYIMIPMEGEEEKRIRINRAHLEEDAGKLIHDTKTNSSLVDYNRTGTPLLEIVTEADMRSPQEAYDYLQTLKLNLQYLNVSDCDMEKGSLRCDANVSIRPYGQEEFGTKAELKNMNSFKAIKAGLEYEVIRQQQIIDSGGNVVQETRLWDEAKQMTATMRSKEEAHDYRYFPEPDLVPFVMDDSVIEEGQKSLPELPHTKFERFIKEYSLSAYDAQIIIQNVSLADFFEACAKDYKETKKICNWLNGALLQELNARKLDILNISLKSKDFVDLIEKVEEGVVSNLIGKDVLKFMIDTGKTAEDIIKEKSLAQVSDDGELEKIVQEIISENEKVANQIREGKESAIGFMVGQAMRKTQGKANPKKIGELVKKTILG